MRTLIVLLVLGLLVGCVVQEKAEVMEEVKDTKVVSEMPVPGIDVEETVVTGAEETTDLTTSENTFDAIDEAVGELE